MKNDMSVFINPKVCNNFIACQNIILFNFLLRFDETFILSDEILNLSSLNDGWRAPIRKHFTQGVSQRKIEPQIIQKGISKIKFLSNNKSLNW